MILRKIPIFACLCLGVFLARADEIFSQKNPTETTDFREVVENKLKGFQNVTLEKVCPIATDSTAARIFREYGAIFVSNGTAIPGRCIFSSEQEIQSFQTRIATQTQPVGDVQITLQKAAMTALLNARQAAAKRKLQITPRGGSLAAGRSYEDTVRLWNSRFLPGLNHWVGRRKISAADAAAARAMPTGEQVAQVLEWESEGFFFSKDLSKSILFSVAAPGASQHNFLLALDVEQFANREVRRILAEHGWFQTVKSDAPHFTFLGAKESELPALGLKSVTIGGQIFWIPNLEP